MNNSQKRITLFLGAWVFFGPHVVGADCRNGPLAGSHQVILSIAPDWGSSDVIIQRFKRVSETTPWLDVDPDPHAGTVGRRGMGWGRGVNPRESGSPTKREGDGRAPAGVFDLSASFGSHSDLSSSRFPYHVADTNGRCVDEVGSSHYNEVIYDQRQVRRDYDSDTVERLQRKDGLYEYSVVVDHNRPPVRGGGSCIFMHVWRGPGKPTTGCTAMPAPQMRETLEWLKSSQRPRLVQLPVSEYLKHKADWCLPDMDLSSLAPKVIDAGLRELIRHFPSACPLE